MKNFILKNISWIVILLVAVVGFIVYTLKKTNIMFSKATNNI